MSLWNNKILNYKNRSPRYCTRTNFSFNKETSFGIRHKASLTIEATIIFPLATGFLVTVLFFFRVIQVQAVVDEALMYVGRFSAVESSVLSSDEEIRLLAEGVMRSTLQKNDVVNEYVEGGNWGISLLESELTRETISLKARYEVKLPISFFGIKTVPLYSQNLFYKWNGDLSSEEDTSWVYITPSGKVYHANSNCRVLDLSIQEAKITQISDLRGMDGQKYYPCSGCEAKKGASEVVYYTDYGRLYHVDINCNALKRTIMRIPMKDVKEREACSYCYSG